jgi:HD superfamily phosphodiesterase
MKILNDPRQRKLFNDVRRFYSSHRFGHDHDINHTIRVMWWSSYICEREGADKSIVIPAAILHDIGMFNDRKEGHAKRSAKMSLLFLKRAGYTEDESKTISETILVHSTGYDKSKVNTIESKVLFDADKMEYVNPVGMQRWLSFFSTKGFHQNKAIEGIEDVIRRWKKISGRVPFYTITGMKIGSKGLLYVEGVLDDIERDYKKFDGIYRELKLK